MDPLDFLIDHAPFCHLGQDGRVSLGDHLEITWARKGERLLVRGDDNRHLYIVRKGSVRLALDGQQLDEVGPGEVFGLGAVSAEPARLDADASTDCLLYRVAGDHVRDLFADEPRFATFFLHQLSERLRLLTDGGPTALTGSLSIPVAELCGRAPVTLTVDATVGDAARLMSAERVSSVLIVDAEHDDNENESSVPIGIVTDRDLRTRVLAHDRGSDTPIRDVMSAPLTTVEAHVTGAEAVLTLLRHGVHHLPIERDGTLIGVVTHSDLLRHHQTGPGALYKKIDKATDTRDLASYADDIAAMIDGLYRGRLPATDIGRVVAALGDALAVHLLRAAEDDLGEPPCPYAWIVFGSEGRQEQSLLTDQDNALVFADDTADAAVYFGRLSARLIDDLATVGFPLCAGGFMATHWHKPLATWQRLFRAWIEEPEPEALIEAANFFDFRVVHGGLDLTSLDAIIHKGGKNRLFLGQFAKASMDMRPPLGILQRIRRSAHGVDLKAGAIMPVVGLARLLALEAGERHGSTLRRLHAAERAGTLSSNGAELLTEAFRYVFDLRLRHQLDGRRAGEGTSNHVHLDALTPVERRHLKDAFVAIADLQKATAERLGVPLLG
ncbi:MAG: DUF294 nucleotidyltransferase-like domain-containing protein [Acidobacteriota bacterium]